MILLNTTCRSEAYEWALNLIDTAFNKDTSAETLRQLKRTTGMTDYNWLYNTGYL
jgi:hypothetical protein